MPTLLVAKESDPLELRTCITAETVAKYLENGFEVFLEEGFGKAQGIDPGPLFGAGAKPSNPSVVPDVVFRIQKPTQSEIRSLPRGALHLSLLDPFNHRDLLEVFAEVGVCAVSLEMIPRITLAQKMDVLSSQANLAGYAAVMEAARLLPSVLPMMMTPAGTLAPARVFVIGVGVAGLQAIATAKRLGARVFAFDTRPVVEEQVRSLGAKFVKIDLGDTGQTESGYAKELTPEQIELQKAGMKKVCASSDVVITTAKLFGRPAPLLVTAEMLAAMHPHSVVVDLAAETGGNVEGSIAGQTVSTAHGVRIIGDTHLESTVARAASQVLSNNYFNFLQHFWDPANARLNLDPEEPILKGCLITSEGHIVHPSFRPS
ncbi:MAG: NAD(P) transhydrogenase subunit alpha [Puniceicoccaceae bacterium]